MILFYKLIKNVVIIYFLRFSLSLLLLLPLPYMTFSPCTLVFCLLFKHPICQVSFYSVWIVASYYKFSTYSPVLWGSLQLRQRSPHNCALFLPAETLCSLCRVPCCFCTTFRGIFHIKLFFFYL